MTWIAALMLFFSAYAIWEVWVGLANGEMTPIGPAGSDLKARRADNPVGFWTATVFNVLMIAGALFAAFIS